MMKLHSIQIGLPKTYGDADSADPMQQLWVTGFYKEPIDGPVQVTSLGIVGDGVADPKNHGGIDKAILAYSFSRYSYWNERLPQVCFVDGGFGENLTVTGMDESSVCIGDRYTIGTAVLEVSQPRQPCWKLGRRWKEKMLPKLVVQTGYTGWYFRVLQSGKIQRGDRFVLLQRPYPSWTVERANDILYNRIIDAEAVTELFLIPVLSESWKRSLG